MSEVIHLTEAAAFQIKDMMEQNDEQDAYFRVSVNGGGCSGLSYGLSLDHEIKEGDAVGEQHGIRILVDHESAPILTGTVIDYKQSLLGAGSRSIIRMRLSPADVAPHLKLKQKPAHRKNAEAFKVMLQKQDIYTPARFPFHCSSAGYPANDRRGFCAAELI